MADQTAGAQTPTDAPASGGQPDAAATTESQGSTLLTDGAGATAGEGKKEGDGSGEPGAGDGKGEPDDGGKEGEKKPEGAPEKYELALPEGVSLDAAVFEKFEPVLRELNLTNEQASKLGGVMAEIRATEAKAAGEAYIQRIEAWDSQVKSDKEIGGAGFEGNMLAARSAIAAFGSPELLKLLDPPTAENPEGFGLGNHPALVRFCMRIGKAIAEDKMTKPGGAGGGQRSIEDRLYGNNT